MSEIIKGSIDNTYYFYSTKYVCRNKAVFCEMNVKELEKLKNDIEAILQFEVDNNE